MALVKRERAYAQTTCNWRRNAFLPHSIAVFIELKLAFKSAKTVQKDAHEALPSVHCVVSKSMFVFGSFLAQHHLFRPLQLHVLQLSKRYRRRDRLANHPVE